jgi:hypothetical protein
MSLFVGYKLTNVNDALFKHIKQVLIKAYRAANNTKREEKIVNVATFEELMQLLVKFKYNESTFNDEYNISLFMNDGVLYLKYRMVNVLENNKKINNLDEKMLSGKVSFGMVLNSLQTKISENDFGLWYSTT